MKTYEEKLSALRVEMNKQGIDGFIIPRADEYQGEFVAPYAERLQWLTGFTGSGGVAAVLKEKAAALTDGRYLIQIDQQVDTSLFETGDMIKAPIESWLAENADENDVIGYDPWLHTPAQIEKIAKKLEGKNIQLKPVEANPLDKVWSDQPDRPKTEAHSFSDDLAGHSAEEKRQLIANKVKEQGADCCILTLPDSICWLLNERGSDTDYIPVSLSYLLLDAENLEASRIDDAKDFASLKGKAVMLDHKRSPIAFRHALKQAGATIIDAEDPCILPKAIKSEQEQEAIKQAHIIDGVALVKFLYWLSQNALSGNLTELSATQKLKEFRAENAAFKSDSFPTIAGYADNGAIVHYRATKRTDKTITAPGLFLVDSGGQYLDEDKGVAGTTDITRTIAIGEPSHEMMQHFTLVLKGHIAVAMAKFPEGTSGAQVDALARQYLWNDGLDYAHGTGHGVGCYMAVHEEAASISPRGQQAFQAGMLISNEPGYYREGEYGIRIENLVLVKKDKNLFFETVSFAPIDYSLILPDMLSQEEKAWLNAYHQKVCDVLSPHLDAEHQEWLKARTQAF